MRLHSYTHTIQWCSSSASSLSDVPLDTPVTVNRPTPLNITNEQYIDTTSGDAKKVAALEHLLARQRVADASAAELAALSDVDFDELMRFAVTLDEVVDLQQRLANARTKCVCMFTRCSIVRAQGCCTPPTCTTRTAVERLARSSSPHATHEHQ